MAEGAVETAAAPRGLGDLSAAGGAEVGAPAAKAPRGPAIVEGESETAAKEPEQLPVPPDVADAAAMMERAADEIYPPYLGVPRDQNWEYAVSFPAPDLWKDLEGGERRWRAAAEQFWEVYGFIVFRDVMPPALCDDMRDSMWRSLEDRYETFSREDPGTWSQWQEGNYGMSGKLPEFTPETYRVRTSEKLYRCAKEILINFRDDEEADRQALVEAARQERRDSAAASQGKKSGKKAKRKPSPPRAATASDDDEFKDDIIVSQDRWLLYRPTEGPEGSKKWSTPRNVHLDMNPWAFLADEPGVYERLAALRYADLRDFVRENNDVALGMGRSIQCIVNFADNRAEDGGTIVIPGSHKFLRNYFSRLPPQIEGNGSFKLDNNEKELQKRAERVPMKEGSVLFWDRRVLHGSEPNASENTRYAMPVGFFKRRDGDAERMAHRASALVSTLRPLLGAANFDTDNLTPVETEVLGLSGHGVTGQPRSRK